MRTTQRYLTVATILAFLAVGLLMAETEKDRPVRGLMRAKLDYAQGILEGLTLENYHMAITNAFAVRNMIPTNSSYSLPFHVDYLKNMTNFQGSVDNLINAARARDLDATTEAYQSMTKSCVECHKQFRREQFIQHQQKTPKR